MTDTLDWTNSNMDDLDMARFEARADAMAQRLREETSADRLPFLTMPYEAELKEQLAALQPMLARFDHMLLLGIGGSALGARALQQAFYPQQGQPGHTGRSLWIADNVDVYALEAFLTQLPPEKTVVVTISKSGGTIETVGQYFILKEWMQHHLGDAWHENMVLVTDEENGFLRGEVDAYDIKSLPVPDNLGGRYSVLSAVGLLPAVFLGMDIDSLLDGAREMAASLISSELTGQTLAGHSAFQLAVWNAALMDRGFDEMIFFAYIPLWAGFGDWFAQLWAESLGKEGKGSQPIPAIGVTDQHSVNQMFMDGRRNKACLFLTCPTLPAGPKFPAALPEQFSYVQGMDFGELLRAEGLGTRMALSASGVPLVELRMGSDGPRQAGKMIALLGAVTLLTGWLMGINPVNQPAVELGKRLAKARMDADGLEREKADLNEFLSAERDIREF
ncbi:glucose-6-phosphate isomerase [Pseudodesulfovibrio sp. JC047]|uniref:glucose-6-phosphate isomerase n=1 Tax=Pseudodesulfovibrio sp. JC047 TaxID=2683199 RepID=UPI0013D03B4D|nr:glucose-6-phosphate isomerase [Pseudodesulfovibrio sp. JC047]NDV20767.1 glucose-6-phosphate isomerase [Pseudodesulfovibrio sp. JC047]